MELIKIIEASIDLDEKLLSLTDEQLAEVYEGSSPEFLAKVRDDLKSRLILCDTLLPGENIAFGEELGCEIYAMYKKMEQVLHGVVAIPANILLMNKFKKSD